MYFQHDHTLPLPGWHVIENLIRAFNVEMKQQNRIFSNCLTSWLFSSKTTSVSQPLDQGIMKVVNLNFSELMGSLIADTKSTSFTTELAKPFQSQYDNTCSIGEGTTDCASSAEMFREGSIFCCDLNKELPTTNCTWHPTHIQHRSLNVYLPQAHNTKWKLQHCINKTQVSLLPIWRKQILNNKMFKCTHTLILELL